MGTDHELRAHRDWIGLLQPVGLVVSPPALLAAQAFPDKNILKEQQALLALITPPAPKDEKKLVDRPPLPLSFAAFATEVLGWKPSKLAGSPSGPVLPTSLEVVLPEFGETLRPTFAVPAVKDDTASDGADEWMMLVQELADGTDFDDALADDSRKWHASPQIRLERLLYETGVPIGILTNGRFVRLVYKPRGESSGHVTWPVHRLVTALDRNMLSALCMLLGSARLFALPREQRLPHILKESRKYQTVVSTKLAGQVLEALNELLRGFEMANGRTKGALLNATVSAEPEYVYGGLLAVLLRLVFVLYAEERGLLSTSAAYVRNYSLVGLFDKLRIDAGRFPDTMDDRYGAWSRLLVLFRMVHDGAKRGDLRLPARYGHLFDPDGWSFLEGRPLRVNRVMGAPVEVPKVPDGVVLRVLQKLLLLDGDRLSYRALDVEQIGSVYENMMGFRLERAVETSIGVGTEHVVVGLETLLAKKGADREKHLKATASIDLTGKASEALKAATTVDDLVAALGRRTSPLTPRTVAREGLYLQPTDERRRSGSHYTPRELTEPIVRTTLRPILDDLGPSPRPEQILALKVCDPAMGSGAFLVETCRQLAEQLEKAYDVHGRPIDIPPDEDLRLYAQRQVAQHCLYGVDKNPFAVDLGKLSLWLATLAKDHAFTFLDHSLRHGDSLVGLTRDQIAGFHYYPDYAGNRHLRTYIDPAINEALRLRAEIAQLSTSDDVTRKRHLLRDADDALSRVRTIGDAVIASFFEAEKPKERDRLRIEYAEDAVRWLNGTGHDTRLRGASDGLRGGDRGIPAFHWQIEFPEVFSPGTRGFDAIVGNPPFLGGKRISEVAGSTYNEWLATSHEGASRNADLVAHFYRRGFALLRQGGAFGLIATNTIAQGDTRAAGLRWIRKHGGYIYAARRRVKWPSGAAVVVSVVHVSKGVDRTPRCLDGREVERITAFLFHRGGDDDPSVLVANTGKSFQGSIVLGMGFTFDDSNDDATPIAEMERLIAADPRNAERIFPYLGGDEVNDSPSHAHHRYVINFGEMSEEEARDGWPDLMDILETKVKPERVTKDAKKYPRMVHEWWKFWTARTELGAAIADLDQVLVIGRVSQHHGPAFLPTGQVYSEQLVVIADASVSRYAVLQSRFHESWFRAFGSTHEERPRYTPSDVFETYPFPPGWEESEQLKTAGREYYDLRARLMSRTGQGLTKTYNRFHNPDETDADILRLRVLHDALDQAVLDAYGWTEDIQLTCEFILDHEDDEDDASSRGRKKKKPWRYRWPDDVRDEVLARLLELNAQRAKEQGDKPPPGGSRTPTPGGKGRRGRARPQKAESTGQGGLFREESK